MLYIFNSTPTSLLSSHHLLSKCPSLLHHPIQDLHHHPNQCPPAVSWLHKNPWLRPYNQSRHTVSHTLRDRLNTTMSSQGQQILKYLYLMCVGSPLFCLPYIHPLLLYPNTHTCSHFCVYQWKYLLDQKLVHPETEGVSACNIVYYECLFFPSFLLHS